MKIERQFAIILFCSIGFLACSHAPKVAEKAPVVEQKASTGMEWDEIIAKAEGSATPSARRVLFTLRQMIIRGEIIRGGNWDYLDTGFTRAGVPEMARKTIFHGRKDYPPYANIADIQPGDWLYFIHYNYGDNENSGVFVSWIDKNAKDALILSYAGERRGVPGRYSVYNLSRVYQIIRP